MASAQEPCLIRIYVERKNGDRKLLHEGRPEIWGAGGSADGSIAVATSQDKWAYLPPSSVLCQYGDKIVITIKLDAEDGLDTTDCYIAVPVQIIGEGSKWLNQADFGVSTTTHDHPASTNAGTWFDLAPGYAVPEGKRMTVGGGRIFLSVEDDTG